MVPTGRGQTKKIITLSGDGSKRTAREEELEVWVERVDQEIHPHCAQSKTYRPMQPTFKDFKE